MGAMVFRLSETTESDLARCREIVRSGGVIAYPTDTFYGLGADPANAAAVKRLFTIKGRKADQPILLLLPDRESVPRWASTTPAARELMDRYWPGPLTLVLPAASDVLPELTAGTGKIGLRVPGHDPTRSLLRSLGMALTGTSANRSGGPAPRSAGEVLRELGESIDLVIDGGPARAERPSTVVDATVDPPKVLRQGAVDITRNPSARGGI